MSEVKTQSKPVAVIIGDVHFTLQTLELASIAVTTALRRAEELKVPLVLNGDTLDTKAVIRGEIANRLITILNTAKTRVIINTGNHDLLSEKGTESSLNFLRPYAHVIYVPTYLDDVKAWIIPYQSDSATLEKSLKHGTLLIGGYKPRLIVHQGVMSAQMGHYVQDKTSIPKEAYAQYRVVASHYHRRQDIQCGPAKENHVGTFSYIGNPYSLSFGEAYVNDGEKGFSILYEDGSLELVPLNLRRHILVDLKASMFRGRIPGLRSEDLLWLKLRGPSSYLKTMTKKSIGDMLGRTNFKLDLIPDSAEQEKFDKGLSDGEILDNLIEATTESAAQKKYLKLLWRDITDGS